MPNDNDEIPVVRGARGYTYRVPTPEYLAGFLSVALISADLLDGTTEIPSIQEQLVNVANELIKGFEIREKLLDGKPIK